MVWMLRFSVPMKPKPLLLISVFFLLVVFLLAGALYHSVSKLAEAQSRVAVLEGAAPPDATTHDRTVTSPASDDGDAPGPEAMCAEAERSVLPACIDLGTASPVGDRLRIASYNLENFADGINDGPQRAEIAIRRQALAAATLIDKIAPDILVLQEVENEGALTWLNRYLETPYPLAFVTRFSTGREVVKLNLAVLSRVPVGGAQEIDFGPLRGRYPVYPPRGTLRFTVDLGEGGHLLGYVVHLKSNWGGSRRNAEKRQLALDILREDIDTFLADRHVDRWEVVILGDMNTDPDAERFSDDDSLLPFDDYLDLWRGRGIEERTTVPTRHGDPHLSFPPACFDRMIVSPSLAVRPWTVGDPVAVKEGVYLKDVYAPAGSVSGYASDHYPIYADLRK